MCSTVHTRHPPGLRFDLCAPYSVGTLQSPLCNLAAICRGVDSLLSTRVATCVSQGTRKQYEDGCSFWWRTAIVLPHPKQIGRRISSAAVRISNCGRGRMTGMVRPSDKQCDHAQRCSGCLPIDGRSRQHRLAVSPNSTALAACWPTSM